MADEPAAAAAALVASGGRSFFFDDKDEDVATGVATVTPCVSRLGFARAGAGGGVVEAAGMTTEAVVTWVTFVVVTAGCASEADGSWLTRGKTP